ncbi:MAG TPA: hypothetical protein VGC09_17205 [Rhodopila sp.]
MEALLPVSADLALPVFAHRATEIGFTPVTRPDGLFIAMAGGDLEIRAEAGQVRLVVTAQDLPHRRCCKSQHLIERSLSPLSSCHAFDFGGAGRIEAIHEGDTDLDFGCLAVRVA